MHEPQRHEPLRTIAWDAERARQAIVEIVDDATTAFDPRRFWLAHALDEQIADGSPTLYWGATGVIWGLDHLRRCGAVTTSRDFTPALAPLLAAHAAIAESYGSLAPYASLFMSDVAPLLLHLRLAPNAAVADRLLARLRDNLGLPPLELMWGVAGSMLVALAMAEPRGDALYRELAAHLLGSLREATEGPIWEQALYNNPPTCLFGLVHGAAGTSPRCIAAGTCSTTRSANGRERRPGCWSRPRTRMSKARTGRRAVSAGRSAAAPRARCSCSSVTVRRGS